MKKTILIIEDELPMLKALSDKFSLEGFEILEAKDGAEGLKAAIEKKTGSHHSRHFHAGDGRKSDV